MYFVNVEKMAGTLTFVRSIGIPNGQPCLQAAYLSRIKDRITILLLRRWYFCVSCSCGFVCVLF